MMQEVFLPSQILPQNLVHLHVCVTVRGVLPGSCDNSSLTGGQNNFSYCQWFQWSSSALVNLISIDQLFILDNIICYNVFHIIEHRESIDVPLQIDALPCEIKQDDMHTCSTDATPSVGMSMCTKQQVSSVLYFLNTYFYRI